MDINQIDELRPMIYHHMCLLTTSGLTYSDALKQAALVAVVAFEGDFVAEAIALVEKSVFGQSNEEPVDNEETINL